MEPSIIIRNGRIVDGTGCPWFKGDVGIEGDRIFGVGDLSEFKAEVEIDARGLVVCPGFVDVHTHSDTSFLVNPRADSKIMQGVTTEIVGNCGNSAAPITDFGKTYYSNSNRYDAIDWDWTSVAEYYDRLEANGLPLNVGTLIGHGTVRASVMGYEARAPSTGELEQMKGLVEQGMRDGAFGLSSGLKYAPGCYAETDEVVELCKVANKYGGIYATHLRNQALKVIEAAEEAIDIGRKTGIPVHIAHIKVRGRSVWGKGWNYLRIIEDARQEGIDVTFDQYPYDKCGSSASIPIWALEGGAESLLNRLRDPVHRKKIESEIPEHEDWVGPEYTIIGKFAPNSKYEGKNLADISKLRNKTPESTVCDLVLESNGHVRLLMHFGWEEEIRNFMKHHLMMVGSDGSSITTKEMGKPHLRNYGTYPRFISKYVLGQGIISLEDGIRRATSFPARRFGLFDRGILRQNMIADLVLFNPKTITDIGTYMDPQKHPKGIEYVLVNGTISVEKETFTGKLTGKTLKHKLLNSLARAKFM